MATLREVEWDEMMFEFQRQIEFNPFFGTIVRDWNSRHDIVEAFFFILSIQPRIFLWNRYWREAISVELFSISSRTYLYLGSKDPSSKSPRCLFTYRSCRICIHTLIPHGVRTITAKTINTNLSPFTSGIAPLRWRSNGMWGLFKGRMNVVFSGIAIGETVAISNRMRWNCCNYLCIPRYFVVVTIAKAQSKTNAEEMYGFQHQSKPIYFPIRYLVLPTP